MRMKVREGRSESCVDRPDRLGRLDRRASSPFLLLLQPCWPPQRYCLMIDRHAAPGPRPPPLNFAALLLTLIMPYT